MSKVSVMYPNTPGPRFDHGLPGLWQAAPNETGTF